MPRAHATFALLAALAAAAAAPSPAVAQERSLYWESLDVSGRLDAAGRLHVAERQIYVFTGDWNGGERRFEVGRDEKLELLRLSRIDPDTGAARPLVEGDLDEVDEYGWGDGNTLRWRSRLPSDPPFDRTRITYLLEYVYEGVVRRRGDLYRLQHDFAFPDRSGVIERFALDLAVAPEWRVEGPFRAHFERRDLSPGDGVVVALPLRYAGAGRPAATVEPLPFAVRAGAVAALAVGVAVLLGLFLSDQSRLGRFSPPHPEIDRGWLEQHLLSQRPEEVGALWDRRTGPPEVAALIARLVGEGKLASRVEEGKGLFAKPVLHLELRADRSELSDYERKLIDKLFWNGRTETDTASVRERYKGSGFDPAKAIAAGIEQRLRRLFPAKAPDYRPPSRKPTLALLLGGLACVGLAGIERPAAAISILFLLATVYLGPWGIALAGAASWRERVQRLAPAALVFALPLLLICGMTVVLLLFEELFGADPIVRLGFSAAALVLLPLAVVRNVLNMARSRESAETIERRQILAAARRWLARELGSRQPQLEDAWYPYLLALGLETEVSRWFHAFGGASGGGMTAGSSAGWSGGGGGLSAGGWSGGGGAFGGGGASAGWGVAVAGLSAGVASPSSSGGSGGGGGGGGGSSGGGGGGGW